MQWNRNDKGLLSELEYQYAPNGLVLWRKVIRPEFLVPNKERFPDKTKEQLAEMNVAELTDDQLVIKLAGLRELAMIRGYTRIQHVPLHIDKEYVAARCIITWIPNFETCFALVETDAWADAHVFNVSELGRSHLAAFAENRAFGRAVRNFLNIPILGEYESDKTREETVPTSNTTTVNPETVLANLLTSKGYSFEELKAKLVKSNIENAEHFNSISDIPKEKIFGIIERLKEIKVKA